MMKACLFILIMFQVSTLYAQNASDPAGITKLYPKNNAENVNPDVHLKITFTSAPPLGITGTIRVYDASNDSVIDELDLSVPPGPKNTRTPPPYDKLTYPSVPDTVLKGNESDTDPTHIYQKDYIGGDTEADAYRFYPVLINGNEATICIHNRRLQYNKTYYIQIDQEAFPFGDGSFKGITGKTDWNFSTKKAPPSADSNRLVVSADGTGDFDTVQGAIEFVPNNNPNPKTIFIKNGIYEEIVYFRNKAKFTLLGEDREKVVIRYANNQPFNSSTGHYKRGVFAEDSSSEINLINFTILNVGEDSTKDPINTAAQAEALYVKGDKYQVHNVGILGSGDALQIQAKTRIYLSQSSIRGYGDNLLSYGAAFFNSCELISTYGPHGWPRNPGTNHGDVFLNSTFKLEGKGTSGDGYCDLARAPSATYPDAEFVLLSSKLEGISPEGFGTTSTGGGNVRYWEYNSVNLSDGKPVDVSGRSAWSRQLTMENDAQTIADYSNPTYVLGGWTPELAPVILTQLPDTIKVAPGEDAELKISVAAAPENVTYQWSKDGKALKDETKSTLILKFVSAADNGEYSVTIKNSVGEVTSNKVNVIVGDSGGQNGTGGAGAQAGAAGKGQQAGAAGKGPQTETAGVGANSSTITSAGTSAQTGMPGSVTGSAGTSASANGDVASSSDSGCGCRIGPERATGSGAWIALLAAFLIVVRTRQRGQR
jgi:pectinesterase